VSACTRAPSPTTQCSIARPAPLTSHEGERRFAAVHMASIPPVNERSAPSGILYNLRIADGAGGWKPVWAPEPDGACGAAAGHERPHCDFLNGGSARK
jgi:hypothetical protein